MRIKHGRALLFVATALALTACGGGGNFTPPSPMPPPPPSPMPPPPPSQGQSVAIFANPQAGAFESVGAAANASDIFNLHAPLGTVSAADGDQLHIRYTSAGVYEVELPGQEWEQLIPYSGTVITDTDNNVFLRLSGSKDNGYNYSELALYRTANRTGALAFGVPTPAGAVPITGSASYTGSVMGKTDVIGLDSFNDNYRATVDGTVVLNFGFASGSLSGAMTVGLNDRAGNVLPIGTFDFKDTVFGIGSTTYSGRFDTSIAGQNFFLGKFTGPTAQETIGAWALPFILNTGNSEITADNQAHQAFGAWIAKRGP